MNLMPIIALPLLALTSAAHGGLTFTNSVSLGTAEAFASVPGGVPQTAGVPYDFSFNPDVTYTRNFTAGSQVIGGGIAVATATSRTTISRGGGGFFIGIFDGVSINNAANGGVATASTSATHEYRFTVDAPVPGQFGYSLTTPVVNGGASQFVHLTFGVVGQAMLVDLTVNTPNQFVESPTFAMNFVPGVIYRVTMESAASASATGNPSIFDGEARIMFSLQIAVPSPAGGAMIACGLGLLATRRRRMRISLVQPGSWSHEASASRRRGAD